MQQARWLQLAFLSTTILSTVALAPGQTLVDLRTQSKSVDFSGAIATKPFKSGSILPSICSVGEMFFNTGSPPGGNLYGCSALNSWVLESGSVIPSVTGNSGRLLATDGTNYFWAFPGGDLSGAITSATVTQIQGHAVSPSAPTSGQTLIWNSTTNRWEPQIASTSGGGTTLPALTGNAGKALGTDGSNLFWQLLSGDVLGALNGNVVTQIQSHPVAPTLPTTGQFLGWNSVTNRWEPLAPPSSGGGGTTLPTVSGNSGKALSTDGTNLIWTATAGDVTGAVGAETVTQIQNHPVAPILPTTGQFLGWNSGTNRWEPLLPPSNTGGGGTTLPTVNGNSGKALTNDGTNLFWAFDGGDIAGAVGAQKVIQMQGHPIAPTAPTAGQVLSWNGTSARWEPQAAVASGIPSLAGNTGKALSTDGNTTFWQTLGGDVFGTLNAAVVTQIQARPIAPTQPTAGQFLGWNATTNRWEPLAPPSGGSGSGLPSLSGNAGKTLDTDGTNPIWVLPGGDLGGTLAFATVTQIQGHAVGAITPAPGQFLGWNGSTGQWEPQVPPTSGGGASFPSMAGNAGKTLDTDGTNPIWALPGGDLGGTLAAATVTQIQGHAVAPTNPAPGQFLGWNSTTGRWEPATPPTAGGGASLPSMSGNSGKILSTDGSNPFWSSPGGDLSGALATATVTQIQGHPIAPTPPAAGQILGWNGSTNRWEPQNPPSGGGGGSGTGASMAAQLGDLQVTMSNSTTLNIGPNCSFATPCNVRFGSVTYSFASGASVNLNGGTGFAYIYVSSAGSLMVGHNMDLSCNGGCIAQAGITSFPSDVVPLYTWSATNGSWDGIGLDQRAFLSTRNILSGPGISTSDSQGQTMVGVDTSVVGIRTSVPGSSSAACSPGNWAADTSFYYLCVNQNTWLRAGLSTF